MNAYELADYVADNGYIGTNTTHEVATMLRQQAENIAEQKGRIVELEKEFDAMVMSFETRLATRGYEIQIKDQADRIAELEKDGKVCATCGGLVYDPVLKQMSKPVAWQHKVAESWVTTTKDGEDDEWIPLYTHPHKQLSDEEINLIREAIGSYVCTIKMEIDQERQTFKGYEHCSNISSLESELKDAERALAIIKEITE